MQPALEHPVSADRLVNRALLRVGQLVRERWHLDAVLGVGGMAAVYAATHRNGKRVALKMLHPELSASPEVRQRFVDEGYLANCVEHPGAVSVIDDDVTEDGHVFLIMDLLDGQNLDQYVGDGGWLLPGRVLTIADAVLDVLAAAHDKGIVHRDVKPDNICITRDGKIRLLDFGIAWVTTPGRIHTTQSGEPLGTPAFMPPEQARGRWDELDGRTDLWAVGATMFFLLTGRHVHDADTINEELLSAMTTPAPSLAEFAPHLPKPLIDLVDRALAFERDDRWANAREMQTAVREVERLLVPEPTVQPSKPKTVAPACPTLVTPSLERAPSPTARPARRFRPALVIALSAAASVAALLAVRQVGHTVRSSAAPASEVAVREARSDRTTISEEWLALAPDRAAPEMATTAFRSTTPRESVPSPQKMSDRGRPKAVARSLEEARTWTASGGHSTSRSTPLASERFRAPASVDPLDRRK